MWLVYFIKASVNIKLLEATVSCDDVLGSFIERSFRTEILRMASYG